MNIKDDSLIYYKNLIDLNNNYNENEYNQEEENDEDDDDDDENDDEEDFSLYKTAIFTKEISKDAIIKPTTIDLNELACYSNMTPSSPCSSSAIPNLNNDSYTSSNNSIQSTSSSSATAAAATKISPDQSNHSIEINSNMTSNNNDEMLNFVKVKNKKKKKTDNLINSINYKRRNTISSIISPSNQTNNSSTATTTTTKREEITNSKKTSKANLIKKLNTIFDSDIFELIEKSDLDQLQHKLVFNLSCINKLNTYEFTPLDMALMLNNVPIIRLLLSNGAKENPNFSDWNDRYAKINEALADLDKNLRNLLQNVDVSNLQIAQIKEYDLKLKNLDDKLKLAKKMKQNIEFAIHPDSPSCVRLESNGAGSLIVYFEEPVLNSGAFIIKYLVEWSVHPSFETLAGQCTLIEVNKNKKCVINNLKTNESYYVRVSCANIKGFGPFSFSNPVCFIPSYWRDGLSKKEIEQNYLKKLSELNDLILKSKQNLEFLNQSDLNNSQKFIKPKKDIKKNLKNLFALALANNNSNSNTSSKLSNLSLNNKFSKQIKKGSAYLLMIIYDGDKILVTNSDDSLPMIEIDENYSYQTLNNDLQFLIKLSLNWTEIDCFKTNIEESINTTSLRFRYQMISVIKQIQSILDVKELGQVYYQCLKHSSNIFFVISKNLQNTPLTNQTLSQQLKLIEIEKYHQKLVKPSNQNASDHEEHCFLAKNIKQIIEFNRNYYRKLTRGFYVSYLKTQSSIELVKVMVSSKMLSIMPSFKIRENPNVTREEWSILKSINYNSTNTNIIDEINLNFLNSIHQSINKLIDQLSLKDNEIENLRILTKELIEISEDITILLICPSQDQICSIKTMIEPITHMQHQQPQQDIDQNSNDFTYLPVQIFESINLNLYSNEFIQIFVRLSILIELELTASQQYQREAFSNAEIVKAKKFVNTSNKYQKLLEELWKESRWIIEAINLARDKQIQPELILSLNLFRTALNTINSYQIKKSNIYNQITKFPANNNLFHHIDSVCIEDEAINSTENSFLSMRFSKKQNNIDNNNNQKWKEKSVLRNNRSNSLAPSLSNSSNIYNVVTKLYISSPQLPNKNLIRQQQLLQQTKNEDNESDSSFILKAKFTNNQLSNRLKILVFIDFKTGLKIETFFECTISMLTTTREIIFNILRKLNNLITKLNKLKQLTDMNMCEYYDDLIKVENNKEDERVVKLMSFPTKFKLNTYEFTENLNENLNLYSLVIVVDSNEKVLIDNFYIAQLKSPWSNGRFYLKRNNLV